MPASSSTTLNARVGAWTLLGGSLMQALLWQASAPVVPMRLLALGLLATGAWAFVDEMGTRKPLVKAGFVAFCAAIIARLIALVDSAGASVGRFYLLFAFAALMSIFIWSVAYLHRQRDLKAAGAAGVLASLAPIAALIVGHLMIGVGAYFGVEALMQASEGKALTNFTAIQMIDDLICVWAAFTAWFLLSDRIRAAT